MDRFLSALEKSGLGNADAAAMPGIAIVSHTGTGTAGFAMVLTCCFQVAATEACELTSTRSTAALAGGSPLEGTAPQERRDIGTLVRVLRWGPAALEVVTRCLELCFGDSARRLNDELHGILLIATSYLLSRRMAEVEGRVEVGARAEAEGRFEKWFENRAELAFLLAQLSASRREKY